MDNTLLQTKADTDPVLKEESRRQYEENYDDDSTSWNKNKDTYKGAVVKPYEQALANHTNFVASSTHSQGVNGNAFDTTLTRYSPNVAEQINF